MDAFTSAESVSELDPGEFAFLREGSILLVSLADILARILHIGH
jgi:hypothetical protein